MRAILLDKHGGPESLRLGEAAEPSAGAGRILVKVSACALNHLDLWVRTGLPAYKISLPHILGCDIAGTVLSGDLDAAGAPVKAGSRVVVCPGYGCGRCEDCEGGHESRCPGYVIIGANGGPGGYAELASVPARCVFPAPEGLADEEAAAFPLTFMTAWHMLVTQAGLKPGQTVLVMGAGSGVGVAATLIASGAGARVIAASTSQKKLDAARRLGAWEGILAGKDDVHRRAAVLTGGRGVDIVFEHVGPAVFASALKSLKPGGILVTCGSTSGPSAELDMRYVFSRELRVHGSRMGSRAEFREVLRWLAVKGVKPVVDSVFPLAEARAAHEHLAAGRQFGKVVLKVS